eukprot:3937572-Rhodomonas_salina.2
MPAPLSHSAQARAGCLRCCHIVSSLLMPRTRLFLPPELQSPAAAWRAASGAVRVQARRAARQADARPL